MDWIQDKIDNAINSRIDAVTDAIADKLTGAYISFVDIIFSILAIALVGYIFYTCIRIMFFSHEQDLQKIIFGFFLLLIVRIFNVILVFKFL